MAEPRPPATGLTTELWRQIPPIMVPVAAVVVTQPIHNPDHTGIIAGTSGWFPESGDPYAHVVVVRGRWLLEDGHHRHRAAINAGESWFPARVYVLHPA